MKRIALPILLLSVSALAEPILLLSVSALAEPINAVYVDPTSGSDANNCRSPGSPCKTARAAQAKAPNPNMPMQVYFAGSNPDRPVSCLPKHPCPGR